MMNGYLRRSFLAVPLFAGLGCSDPAPVPAQGAVTLSIGQLSSPVSEMSCPITSTYQVAGADKNNVFSAPSNQGTGISVVSGTGGATITCSVKGSGGGFTFSGSLDGVSHADGKFISIQFANGTIGSDFNGTVDVQVRTPDLSATFSGTGCALTVVDKQIKGGALWATFSCPQVASPPSGLCQIRDPSSAILFENCAGG